MRTSAEAATSSHRCRESTTLRSTPRIRSRTVAAQRMELALLIAVDDQAGLVRSIVKPGAEFDEPIGECSLFVEGGAVVHDPHRQRHDVGIEPGEVCQQLAVGADH